LTQILYLQTDSGAKQHKW